ncbi:MAG: DUF255 domain-containing protein [Flavihumibacter sp.]
MPKIILWAGLLLFAQTALAQSGMKWMTLAEAEAAAAGDPRPILIDLYTDWCGWCKVMDKKTYKNKNVYNYLNSKFYAVKLDAESRSKLAWKGKSYSYNVRYRVNEIALFLSPAQLSYPTTVIIPPGTNEPQPIPGFLEPKDMELLVKYFGEGAYKTSSFPEYQRGFKGNW